jgi:hydrogenase expression/formation protein HypE
MTPARITLAHGAGGRAMRRLIDEVFIAAFGGDARHTLEDQAQFPLADLLAAGDRLAFTTDSHVVAPLFFPGGDIGTLAVAGTVNDLAVGGATPLYLSCGFIIEEGLDIDVLKRVAASMRRTADAAGVAIVTGDTKVVERGAADKLFINTAGIGVVRRGVAISARHARPGDTLIANGTLGDHGAAILIARGALAIDAPIQSDCRPLHGLVAAMLDVCPQIHCLRDATRGGVAAVLNEFAQASRCGIAIRESELPMSEAVRGACELLGLDPLYLANEGKLIAVVPPEAAAHVLAAMRAHPDGERSAIIGEVSADAPGTVTMRTTFGGQRVVDMLVGDQLPRIC